MSTLRAERGRIRSLQELPVVLSWQTPGFITHYNCIRGERGNSLKEIRHQQEGGMDVKQPKKYC